MTFESVRRGGPEYPSLLAQLHDPPDRLWLRGGPGEVLARPAVAVVGARSCSAYGAQVARTLARELTAAGLVVVSGLARGIDGEATGAHSTRAARLSRCSAAASIATTPRAMPTWLGGWSWQAG